MPYRNTGVGLLTYFIPKVHERSGQVENNGIRPRGSSVLSVRWTNLNGKNDRTNSEGKLKNKIEIFESG